MSERIPPMSALRAFEAASRTLSFTRAAEELNLTQAAISYQVRNLEMELGKPLFHRTHSRLSLTDAGAAFVPFVREALDQLSRGMAKARSDVAEGIIRISATQSLAARWLARRIDRFRALHPGYEVRIEATDDVVDVTRGDADIAIRYARSVDPKLTATLLSTDRVFPVCNPGLLSADKPLNTPSDLAAHTLLHDVMEDVTWDHWLAIADVSGVDPKTGITFSHSGLIVDAAIDGHGVALGRALLVSDAIASGRLVVPFDIALSSNYAYFLVHTQAAEEDPKTRAFKDWVTEEARHSELIALSAMSDE